MKNKYTAPEAYSIFMTNDLIASSSDPNALPEVAWEMGEDIPIN